VSTYVSEYHQLLDGLGAENPTLAPAQQLQIIDWCNDKNMSYVCGVELEVLLTSIQELKPTIGFESGDAMVERLWEGCKKHRLTTLKAHPTEKYLRIVSRSFKGEEVSDEDMQLLEEAKQVIRAIEANAFHVMQGFEFDIATSMEGYYEDRVELAVEEGKVLVQARNEFEVLEQKCNEELAIQSAAVQFLKAKEENDSNAIDLEELRSEMAMLEEELAQAEEAARDVAEHLSSLEAVKANKLEVETLRQNSRDALKEADEALDSWNMSSALRSWVPRELGTKGDVVVDLPLLPYGACGGDVSRLRLKLECGTEGDHVQNIHWVVISKPESSSKILEDLGHPSPFTKRHKRNMYSHAKGGEKVMSSSVVDKLRSRLVNEWVGREASKLSIQGATLHDVPKTLNRFDALVGRLNLVLEEVRKIECLGLFVSFRDGDSDEDESHSAGLWLQVDMSSVKHHCKVCKQMHFSFLFFFISLSFFCQLLSKQIIQK
jgi:hypothetical protein